MIPAREELKAEIAREQGRVDEMKRRRMGKRADGTEYIKHLGYDQEIDDVEDWLSTKRGVLARLYPETVREVRIFLRPAKVLADVDPEGTRLGAHPATRGSLPELSVVRDGQTVRSVDGRARVFDAYALRLDGRQVLIGTRREVMYQVNLAAHQDAMGRLPLYLEPSAPRWLQRDSLHHVQIANRRLRRQSRKRRKWVKMQARRMMAATDYISASIAKLAKRVPHRPFPITADGPPVSTSSLAEFIERGPLLRGRR